MGHVVDAQVVADTDGTIVDWDRGSERLFGYGRDEMLGRSVSVLSPSGDREHPTGDVLGSGEGARVFHAEFPVVGRHGKRLWTEVVTVPLLDDEGRRVGTVRLFRDVTERVEAERELRAAESRFRSLVEHSLVGIHIARGNRYLYVNPKYEELSGYSVEELLSEVSVLDLVAPEDRPLVEDTIRRRLAGEEIRDEYSFRALRKDGSTIYVQVHGTRMELDGSWAVIGMVQDITEQRQAEERLRASEERYRLIAQANTDVFRDWDVITGAVTWDPTAYRAFGYDESGMGDTVDWWQDRIHPDDRAEVLGSLDLALESGDDSWRAEYRFQRGDGEYAVILDRAHVVRSPAGRAVRFMSSMHDVTERVRATETQAFLARASSLLDTSLDVDAVLTTAARACVPFLADCCLVDLVERDSGELRRVATAQTDPGCEPLLTPPTPVRLEDEARDDPVVEVIRTGEPILLQSLMVVPLIVRGEVLGTITLGRSRSRRRHDDSDLTTAENLARRTAQALDNALLYQRAQAAIRARDDILAVVAHDLRDPLSVIQMSANLLKDMGQERRSENQHWLEMILRLSGQMNGLIADLLDLSSIESGSFSVSVKEESLSSFIRDSITLLEPLAREKEIRLTSRVPDELATVRIDSKQVLRVLSNLVGNAIKFTPPGGSVTLRAELDGDTVRMAIKDTGPGIATAQLDHIFDQYWQGRSGDSRGVGLGLAIARGIVEAHGGRIWAESQEGHGTTIWFELPVAGS